MFGDQSLSRTVHNSRRIPFMHAKPGLTALNLQCLMNTLLVTTTQDPRKCAPHCYSEGLIAAVLSEFFYSSHVCNHAVPKHSFTTLATKSRKRPCSCSKSTSFEKENSDMMGFAKGEQLTVEFDNLVVICDVLC